MFTYRYKTEHAWEEICISMIINTQGQLYINYTPDFTQM